MAHRHNGHANYETWAVGLWLSNDYDTDREIARMTRAARSEGQLAQQLKELVEDAAPDIGASLYTDLLQAALSGVDWYELAEGYIEAYSEPGEAEDGA